MDTQMSKIHYNLLGGCSATMKRSFELQWSLTKVLITSQVWLEGNGPLLNWCFRDIWRIVYYAGASFINVELVQDWCALCFHKGDMGV